MLRICKLRNCFALVALGAVLAIARVAAQEESKETPLGDVARNLRKKPANHPVIDDDNLPEVMQQAETQRGWGTSMRSLMSGEGSIFRLSAPDVTCNLSFSANVKSLLSKQYAEMALPTGALARLEGHASTEGDVLNVSVHNGTDWHVSEIAVAFTVLKRSGSPASTSAIGPAEDPPSASGSEADKKPDTTFIYRMRAVGVPWTVTNFSSRLQSELESGSEWHWGIVEARGYPPESYLRGVPSQIGGEGSAEDAIEVSVPTAPSAGQRMEVRPASTAEPRSVEFAPSSQPQ
jgi:hypothetical protein